MDWYKGNVIEIADYGVKKTVLNMDYTALDKPHEVATVIINVHEVKNLDEKPSQYLSAGNLNKSQEMIMGTALTPVDMILELAVREMIIGETAIIEIQRKSNPEPLKCTVSLRKIVSSKEIHKLSTKEVYELALKYKNNGVELFKTFPQCSQSYFSRALMYLVSLKPLKEVKVTKSKDGIDKDDIKNLFNQLRLNLAASYIAAKRYEDVIYLTKFIDKQQEPSEKGVYRRATALLQVKEFEKANKLIEEKVPNYTEKKEFATLHKKIMDNWHKSEDTYKSMVRRMFN